MAFLQCQLAYYQSPWKEAEFDTCPSQQEGGHAPPPLPFSTSQLHYQVEEKRREKPSPPYLMDSQEAVRS